MTDEVATTNGHHWAERKCAVSTCGKTFQPTAARQWRCPECIATRPLRPLAKAKPRPKPKRPARRMVSKAAARIESRPNGSTWATTTAVPAPAKAARANSHAHVVDTISAADLLERAGFSVVPVRMPSGQVWLQVS